MERSERMPSFEDFLTSLNSQSNLLQQPVHTGKSVYTENFLNFYLNLTAGKTDENAEEISARLALLKTLFGHLSEQ